MVLVVHVPVIVSNRRMEMLVVVPGNDEQRNSCRHRDCCENVTGGPAFREEWDREQRTCERRRREHGGLTSCAQGAQRVGVEQDADPVCRGTECQRAREHSPAGKCLSTRERQPDVHQRGDTGLHRDDLERVTP